MCLFIYFTTIRLLAHNICLQEKSGSDCRLLIPCDRAYKPHRGEQGVKEQLWAQVALRYCTCKANTCWRWHLKREAQQLRRKQVVEGGRSLL